MPASTSSPRYSSMPRWVVPVLLAWVAAWLWCYQNNRLTPENWRYPLDYAGDTLENLLRLKAVADGELMPFQSQLVTRLGAPFGADWSEYPVSDKPLFLVFGLAARLMGVYPASNLAVMMTVVTAALSFYFCARYLKAGRAWSFAGGLLFAFSPFSIVRGLPHLWLAFTYTVPLGLLTCWLVGGSRRLEWKTPRAALCLGTAAIFGVSNPYNLFFFMQLLGLSLLVQLLGPRRRANLGIGFSCALVAAGAWMLLQGVDWLHASGESAVSLVERNYAGTEIYGLKPVELFVPLPGHRWEWFAALASRYGRWAYFTGEPYCPYLGVVGVAGLIGLLVDFLSRVARGGRSRLPAYLLQTGWIMLFAVPGGLNSLISLLFGFHVFRAGNRFGIFILALALVFLVVRLTRLTRRWPRWSVPVLACILSAVGLADQLPRSNAVVGTDHVKRRVEHDERMGRNLEARVPVGASVFQLPFVEFPEAIPPNGLQDYEHFRLYMATRTVRSSYGGLKGRATHAWQRGLSKLAPARLIAELERSGFDAVMVDRRGYADRGQAWVAALEASRKTVIWDEPASDFVIFQLNPVRGSGALPLASGLTFGSGWYYPLTEGRETWAHGPASLSYYNPYPTAIAASLHFEAKGVTPRKLVLKLNGVALTTIDAGLEPRPVWLEKVILRPGINAFELSSPASAVRIPGIKQGLRSFAVEHLDFQASTPLSPLADGPVCQPPTLQPP